ncbi:MAG: hypothetical protein ABFD69_14530 [Candidatus Sumerlaeia bacterium]
MATRPRLPVTPLLVRLVLIPAALVSVYFACPFPLDWILALILGIFLVATKSLNKWVFAAGLFVWPIAAAYLFCNENYTYLVMLVCLGFFVYGCVSVSRLAGKKPWHPGVVLAAALLYAAAGLCAVWVQRFEWVPYPKWCKRTIVKAGDYRLMQRIYRKPLPASFHIDQVRYYPYTFPAPDGPTPAMYEIKLQADDCQALLANLNFEEKTLNPDQGWRDIQILEAFKNPLFDQLGNGNGGEAKRVPKKLIIINNSSMIIDDRSSPTLLVYVSSYLPYMKKER